MKPQSNTAYKIAIALPIWRQQILHMLNIVDKHGLGYAPKIGKQWGIDPLIIYSVVGKVKRKKLTPHIKDFNISDVLDGYSETKIASQLGQTRFQTKLSR